MSDFQPFDIYDVVKGGRIAEPLVLVKATVIRQTETIWYLEVRANTYGGFRFRSKVPRDAYARTPEDAWRQFMEDERLSRLARLIKLVCLVVQFGSNSGRLAPRRKD